MFTNTPSDRRLQCECVSRLVMIVLPCQLRTLNIHCRLSVFVVALGSNSIGLMCCGFVVKLVGEQLYRFKYRGYGLWIAEASPNAQLPPPNQTAHFTERRYASGVCRRYVTVSSMYIGA